MKTPSDAIAREKMEQAVGLLNELNLDAWLLFVRETTELADPSWKIVSPAPVVWQSAIIVSRTGERIAIVGYYDAEGFKASGLFSQGIGYHQGIGPDLRSVLSRLDPQTIALNYSQDNHAADGLTYGMYLVLKDILVGTPYAERIVCGEVLSSKLRGRKSPGEVERIVKAIRATEALFREVGDEIRPGRRERDIAAFLHQRVDALCLETAWERSMCPVVNTGPESPMGHASPTGLRIRRGHLVHLDFGVRRDGFCSDIQRMWYVPRSGERRAPREIQRAFDTVRRALEAGFTALRPGVAGWQVDAAARAVIVEAGYPEYLHALGHQLGRAAHDGATILGPRWERYGATPLGIVEAGEVYTLELGISTPAGYLGLEEDVLVTGGGCQYLTRPQTRLMLVE
jgi:Xaa-Pro aminopeptidase